MAETNRSGSVGEKVLIWLALFIRHSPYYQQFPTKIQCTQFRFSGIHEKKLHGHCSEHTQEIITYLVEAKVENGTQFLIPPLISSLICFSYAAGITPSNSRFLVNYHGIRQDCKHSPCVEDQRPPRSAVGRSVPPGGKSLVLCIFRPSKDGIRCPNVALRRLEFGRCVEKILELGR